MKKIILTYLLCILIIPFTLSFLWGALGGMYFGKQLSKVDIGQVLKERNFQYKNEMTPEEEKKFQEIVNQEAGIDSNKVMVSSIIFALVIAALQGLCAGLLLRSLKHLFIIAGIIWAMFLLKPSHTVQDFMILFSHTFILISTGYLAIKWEAIKKW